MELQKKWTCHFQPWKKQSINEAMEILEPARWIKPPSFGGGKQDMKKTCLKTSTLDPRHKHGSQKSLESFQMLPLQVQLPKKFFGFFCFLDKALLRACSFKNVHRIATSFSLVPLKSSLIQNSFTLLAIPPSTLHLGVLRQCQKLE